MSEKKNLRNYTIELNDINNINDLNIDNSVVSYSDVYETLKQKKYDNDEKRSLAAAVLGLGNTDIPLPDKLDYYTGWTDKDAQECYLLSKPKTYIILGKQGCGSYNLGEAMAKKINCPHLCPKNVLQDEIDQKSSVGKCLDYNMKHNKVSKSDIILKIIKNKLESPAIKHRGFILSGLPMVTSSLKMQYYSDSLYAEESISVVDDILFDVIYNLKRKKRRAKKSSPHSSKSSLNDEGEIEAEEEEQEVEEEQEEANIVVELPKFLLEPCRDLIFVSRPYYTTKEKILLNQVQGFFGFKPDIVIYISCPNSDVVIKRTHKFLNYSNGSSTFAPFSPNMENDIRWPPHYTMVDYNRGIDKHTFNPKYNCKQPTNFTTNSSEQICNYKKYVTPLIEEKLKEFDPRYVIKVDGRTPIQQMMNIIMERLLTLPIKPVLLPEPLYIDEPPDELEEFWKTVEELNVIRSGSLSFNRYSSPWYNRCPVELRKRRSTQGNPKFAVTFFKHVYLLSSLDAMVSFCRNPRPYLQLKYLEPTCRMIILGTKSSGKTMIAKCLSWIFTAPVICFESFLKTEKQRKYDSYAKNIFSEIMATIEDNRFTKWQAKELQRVSDLNTWYNTVSSALSSYIPILKKTLEIEGEEGEQVRSKRFYTLRNQLSYLPIDNLVELGALLKDKNALLKYAPHHLLMEITKPKTPVLGDEDVTNEISSYIVTNDLQKDIDPTTEELMNEIIRIVKDIDKTSLDDTGLFYGKFIIDGFPSDPEYWGYLIKAGLLPDYTITIIENREIDADLLQHYINIGKYTKHHQERFLLSSDVLVKTKLLHDEPPENKYLDMQIIIDNLILTLFDSESIDDAANKTEKSPDADAVTGFTETMEKFREEWEVSKSKLEENYKCFVETEIEDKSDIDIIDEVLKKIRNCYFNPCVIIEEGLDIPDDDSEITKDVLTYNEPRFLGETNIYCPLAFYDYGVLWEGKSELATSYDNKTYCFSKEECVDIFQRDVKKYLCYNKPYKNDIPLRICVIGNIGSGKTTYSRLIAKELGLFHIDFKDFINKYLIPKHFKKVGWQYENRFTDASVGEEEVVELQIDEENLNYISDITFNEQELRRIIYNYIEHGSPLLSPLLQPLLKKLWNEQPFNNRGVVIDGFPKLPTDVEDMISCFCIPEIVIEIESDSETSLNRISPKMFKQWKLQLAEAKLKAKNKLDREKQEWLHFVTKTVVIKLIIDDILGEAVNEEEPLKISSVESTIFDANPLGSANVDVNLFRTYNELIQEYPEPVDQNVWESADDVLEHINNRIESIFEIDDENIQVLKDMLLENKIKIVSVDGKKSKQKIQRKILSKLSNIRNRTPSFLEQTFIVNCDIAEMLLLEGFFLLSKFYRMCPVFISENPETKFNPYSLNKRKNKVFPIIHRAYIYFISSEDNVKKFRRDPLKYINNDQIKSYKEHPLRIGIIGPPKSGKSTVAAKLAKRYGLMCMSKGMAIRHILENMDWTTLGFKMKKLLKEGKCIDNELIMTAVLTASIDHRTMTNGFVLDGFPETPFEICQLLKYGLYPLIIVDVKSDEKVILDSSQNEIYPNILKIKPPFSRPFIKKRYDKWLEKSSTVRNWINRDTQNLHTINGNNSQWHCFLDAYSKIEDINKDIHYYLSHVNTDVVTTKVMCLSNEMFEQRMSCYKNLCPLCFHKNIIRHNGYPADKNGVVQYKNYFYWICPEHLDTVLESPEDFLNPVTIEIPEIPTVVTAINTALVYENGICIVTYAENLPSQKLVRGKNEFAATYKKYTYLFCSSGCLKMFLARPHFYYDIKVFKDTSVLPKLTLNKLPHLGYLEQTIGNILTEACCSVNVLRPKYPGLDTRLSGILYIALYLKIHNPKTNHSILPIYSRTLRAYESKCKLITDTALRLRSIDNPFAFYPKCCKGINKIKQIDSGTVRKPSSYVSSGSVFFDSDFE
ncbi:adenylate kinase 9-like [Danaus plexippus]|uniref:adenylate kinase 9-like n=1 Tax=Danaus plexippus TaxID=13037 RepID=UPI002AB265AE|nr:adenylate kinase 9-like [Danaus plexippus]